MLVQHHPTWPANEHFSVPPCGLVCWGLILSLTQGGPLPLHSVVSCDIKFLRTSKRVLLNITNFPLTLVF